MTRSVFGLLLEKETDRDVDKKEQKKLVMSGSLLLFAVACALFLPSKDRVWCLAAMGLSFLGDLLLLDVKEIRNRVSAYFQLGATAFGMAHICYGAAYLTLLKMTEAGAVFNLGSGISLTVMACIWTFFVGSCLKRKKQGYLSVVLFYILFIGLAFCAVFTYAWAAGIGQWRSAGAVFGAIAFVISDFCLGASRIAGLKRLGRWIWVFYPIGQLLLILCG